MKKKSLVGWLYFDWENDFYFVDREKCGNPAMNPNVQKVWIGTNMPLTSNNVMGKKDVKVRITIEEIKGK